MVNYRFCGEPAENKGVTGKVHEIATIIWISYLEVVMILERVYVSSNLVINEQQENPPRGKKGVYLGRTIMVNR